ncbi:unnamed protein product, partial [Rotaria magnacalcarata]
NQHTSDNRHHLAIWCRAEVFTFGALTTPPPPDITPAVSDLDKEGTQDNTDFSSLSKIRII